MELLPKEPQKSASACPEVAWFPLLPTAAHQVPPGPTHTSSQAHGPHNRQGGLWVQKAVTESDFKKSSSCSLIRKVMYTHSRFKIDKED